MLIFQAEDDARDSEIRVEDISPKDQMQTLSHDSLLILLETLQSESKRMQSVTDQLANCSDREVMKSLRPRQMLQAVKAVCALLGNIETLEIQEICDQLVKQCLAFDRAKGNEEPSGRIRPEIVEEVRFKDGCNVKLSLGFNLSVTMMT